MIEGSNCTFCGPGKYQTGLGVTTENLCMECQIGTYQTGWGVGNCSRCTSCNNSLAFVISECNLTANTVCVAPRSCLAGEYEVSGNGTCIKCEPGTYSTGLGVQQMSACLKCPQGTFQTGRGMIAVSNCSLCNSGTYQSSEGMTSSTNCTPCPAGTYQTNNAVIYFANCTKCGVGTYQTGVGMPDAQNCTNCPVGKYHFNMGASSVSVCKIFTTPSSDIHLTFSEVQLPSGHYSAQLKWTAPSDSGYFFVYRLQYYCC